jgi:hypothetical protein
MTAKFFISSILFTLFLCTGFTAGAKKILKRSGLQTAASAAHSPAYKLPMKKNPFKLPKNSSRPFSEDQEAEKHGEKTEEIPHIHHFHKHRVKKLKHHHQVWLSSKALVILCHLVMLVICYLHAIG